MRRFHFRTVGLAATLVLCLVPSADAAGPAGGRVVAWGDADLTAATPAGLRGVTAIATSGYHALALRSDGGIVAWGDDSDGECRVPAGVGTVTAIAAGPGYSLAVRSDGTVAGWGRAAALGPVRPPPGLDRVVAVAAGEEHALALRTDGTVVGWGGNRDGQATVPDRLRDVVAIGAGGFFSVALRSDGTLVVWGYSVELGDVLYYPSPERPDSPSNPVRDVHGGYFRGLNVVAGTGALGRFTAIDAEYDHVVAVGPGGSVHATGSRYNPGNHVPSDLDQVVAVATGSFHNLALRSDGSVVAWGGRTPDRKGVTRVPRGLRGVTAIAAGKAYNLAITIR